MLTFLMILHANYIHSYSVTTFTAGIKGLSTSAERFLTSIGHGTSYVNFKLIIINRYITEYFVVIVKKRMTHLENSKVNDLINVL